MKYLTDQQLLLVCLAYAALKRAQVDVELAAELLEQANLKDDMVDTFNEWHRVATPSALVRDVARDVERLSESCERVRRNHGP